MRTRVSKRKKTLENFGVIVEFRGTDGIVRACHLINNAPPFSHERMMATRTKICDGLNAGSRATFPGQELSPEDDAGILRFMFIAVEMLMCDRENGSGGDTTEPLDKWTTDLFDMFGNQGNFMFLKLHDNGSIGLRFVGAKELDGAIKFLKFREEVAE